MILPKLNYATFYFCKRLSKRLHAAIKVCFQPESGIVDGSWMSDDEVTKSPADLHLVCDGRRVSRA